MSISLADYPLLKRIVGVGAVRGAAAFFAFIFNVLVARELGAAQAGQFFLVFSLVSALSVIVRMGMDNVLLRIFSLSWGKGDIGAANGIALQIFSYVLLFSLAVTALFYIGSGVLSNDIFSDPSLQRVIEVFIVGVPLLALSWLIGTVFQAMGLNAVQVSIQSLFLPLFMSILIFFGDYSLQVLVGIWISGAAILLLISFGLVSSRVPWFQEKRYIRAGEIYREAVPMWWMQSLKMVQMWGVPLFLGVFVASQEFAWFHAANRLTMLVGIILLVVSNVLAPKFSQLYDQGDMPGLARLAQHSVRYLLLLSVPVIILAVIYAEELLLLFGEDFTAGAGIFRILIIGQIVNVLTGSVGYLLMMTKHGKRVSQTATINVIILLVLGSLFIPDYGLTAAAYVLVISMSLTNLLNVVWVKRELGFNALAFWR